MLDGVSRSQQHSSGESQHENVLIVLEDDYVQDCSSLGASAGSAAEWLATPEGSLQMYSAGLAAVPCGHSVCCANQQTAECVRIGFALIDMLSLFKHSVRTWEHVSLASHPDV
jgi:hypothetical protein